MSATRPIATNSPAFEEEVTQQQTPPGTWKEPVGVFWMDEDLPSNLRSGSYSLPDPKNSPPDLTVGKVFNVAARKFPREFVSKPVNNPTILRRAVPQVKISPAGLSRALPPVENLASPPEKEAGEGCEVPGGIFTIDL